MSILRLGGALWRSTPGMISGTSRKTPDFVAAARFVGATERLERKPWVMLGDVRTSLQEAMGLAPDELLACLASWLGATTDSPSCVGMAHASGNVYFGPALDLGGFMLSPEQTLLANLFVHGEIGLDAIACPEHPSSTSIELLREVKTFKTTRWIDSKQVPDNFQELGHATERDIGTIIRPAPRNVLRKHPLVADLSGGIPDQALLGNCLMHPNFKFLELEGDGMDEWHACHTRNSATRSYSPNSDGSAMGCAVLTRKNALFAGFSIRTQCGLGSITPLQSALVSLAASSGHASDIVKVLWTAVPDTSADLVGKFKSDDQKLLRVVCPEADFSVIPYQV